MRTIARPSGKGTRAKNRREPLGDSDGATRIYARRDRHRRRSLAVRVLAAIAGGLLAAAGIVLALPLPEAGVPALLGGLSLLALEFDWAAAALIRVERAWARFKRLPGIVQVAVLLVLATILLVVLVLVL